MPAGNDSSVEEVRLDVGFLADIIMDQQLIIEIKSSERIDRVHHKTVLTCLALSGIKLGLLLNFNVEKIKEGIHRKILGQLT